MLFTYLFKHSTTMTVITMATRHTTTITAPTVMPISLAQLQEHMAVSAVTELSISKKANHDHCVSSSNHVRLLIVTNKLTSSLYSWSESERMDMHILTNVASIHKDHIPTLMSITLDCNVSFPIR